MRATLLASSFGVLAGHAQAPAISPVTQPSAGYALQDGDDLEITFPYNPELNQHAPIRPDGRISMPLIGEVEVQGRTIAELTHELEKAYASELKRISLNVQVRSLPNQVYFVGGEVSRPGVLPLRGAGVTALQGIIEAGGLKQTAVRGNVILLRRGTDGKPEVHTLLLQAKKGEISEAAKFEMQPLDVLIVSETRISRLDRVVDQYVKQLSPVLLTGGFTYLFGNTVTYP